MSERIAAWAGPLAGLALFAFAAVILHRELAEVDYRDVLVHFHAVPASRVVLAFGLTVAGYLALTGYDTLALRWLGQKLAYPRIALASFVAYVLSHNVGFAFLSGSAVRYRMFTSWGVPAAELARAITFNILTFWLGFLTLGGAVLTFAPLALPASWARRKMPRSVGKARPGVGGSSTYRTPAASIQSTEESAICASVIGRRGIATAKPRSESETPRTLAAR